MGQSYLKNAALLTGADVLLRLAGMGLRIYLANALGGEGMGLYQLVLAVYALFVTLATAGVSVAATRLMAEELARGRAQARGMLVRLAGTGLLLGAAAMAAQYGLAGAAARWWLGDVRAAGALRVSAFGMPWMALSAVLRGFFIARRRVEPNVQQNLEAVLQVMKFIYDNIIYAELNTKSDYCQVCGWDGEIDIVEEGGKLIWRCPKCGNTDQDKMNVARRTCGYIGTQFWNQGRTQEIKERVLHL